MLGKTWGVGSEQHDALKILCYNYSHIICCGCLGELFCRIQQRHAFKYSYIYTVKVFFVFYLITFHNTQ